MTTTRKSAGLIGSALRNDDYTMFKFGNPGSGLLNARIHELVDGSYYYHSQVYHKFGIGTYIIDDKTMPGGHLLLDSDEILSNFDNFCEIGRFISPSRLTIDKSPISSIEIISKGYSFYLSISRELGYPGAVLLTSPSIHIRDPDTGKEYIQWGSTSKSEIEERRRNAYRDSWKCIKQALVADVALLSTPKSYSWNKFLIANEDWHTSDFILNGNSDNLIALGVAEIGR